MANPFLSEIRIFAGNFAPQGWALCDGTLLPILQNTALYSLLGTTYGGDGQTTFGLPDLRGRTPLQPGQGAGLSMRVLGESGGDPTVTLIESEMPPHSHTAQAAENTNGSSMDPTNQVWSKSSYIRSQVTLYKASANVSMSPGAVSLSGAGQPHNNMMPYLTLTFIIALQGIYPQRP
jgi:microcystin-dependent protein